MSNKESGSELEYERQTEIEFRSAARAMRMFGQWIAEKMNFPPEEREAYGKSLIQIMMEHGGDGAVFKKVMADMTAAGIPHAEDDIRHEMVRIRQEARKYVMDNPA